MSNFRYKAARYEGEIVEGVIHAQDQAAALAQLQSQKLIPIQLQALAGGAIAQRTPLFNWGRVRHSDISAMTQQLAGLLQSGLPLDRALTLLHTITAAARLRRALGEVQQAVRAGSSLAEALQAQQGVFSPFYINLVRAGEAGGALDRVLGHLAGYLERRQWLREVLVSALIYPVILCVVALASILLLLTFVVPQFEQLFAGSDQLLPLSTRITIEGGRLVQNYYWVPLLALAVLVPAWRLALTRYADLRYRWQRLQLRLPLFGELLAKVHTARWCHMLATLLGNGIPMVQALKIVLDSQESELMRRSMQALAAQIAGGERFGRATEALSFLPPLARQMIQVGDETGELVAMLEKMAGWYDRDVEATLKRMMALLEPLMILVMGAIIAWVVISILMALLSINELAF